MKCIIVLPCYNEEKNLKPLISSIEETVGKHMPYQIVAINDGSIDNTRHLLETLSKEYPITIQEHNKNEGLASTLSDGLTTAISLSSYEDLIITMDSDNTHDPHYVLDMAKSATNADIVIGSRYIDGGKQLNVPTYRVFLSKIINLLIHEMTRIPAKDATSGYRCFKASAIQEAEKKFDGRLIVSKGFEASLEILLKTFWCKASIKEVPILLDYGKKGGISKMKLFPTIKQYLTLFTRMKKWKNKVAL